MHIILAPTSTPAVPERRRSIYLNADVPKAAFSTLARASWAIRAKGEHVDLHIQDPEFHPFICMFSDVEPPALAVPSEARRCWGLMSAEQFERFPIEFGLREGNERAWRSLVPCQMEDLKGNGGMSNLDFKFLALRHGGTAAIGEARRRLRLQAEASAMTA